MLYSKTLLFIYFTYHSAHLLGSPSDSVVKNPPANEGDAGSIPGSGRSPGEGNSNPLQCFWLENPMNRGAWWATVHGVVASDMTQQPFTAQHPAILMLRLLAWVTVSCIKPTSINQCQILTWDASFPFFPARSCTPGLREFKQPFRSLDCTLLMSVSEKLTGPWPCLS